RQPVHIPAYMVELISKWKIASRRLEQQNGVPPTVEQLARELDLPLKKVNIIKRAINALKSPSQEGTGASDDLMSLGEMISDSSVGTPDDRVLQSEQINVLRRLLETIDPREATVLRLRFGLDGRDPLTLKEIAGEIGISRERVRQVVEEALTRLHDRLNDAKPSQFFRRDDAHVKAPASRGPQLVG
ncbi:MAG: sigma-70 family RNA polymerase sigma factor, partial [Planctomycetota bacterium]